MKTADSVWKGALFFLILMLLYSCRDNSLGSAEYQEKQGLKIASVNPMSGTFGTEVTISGSEFGKTPDENVVTFNGHPAEIINMTEKSLDVIVPKGARSGPVKVTVNGASTTGPVFNYILTVNVSTHAGSGKPGYADGEANAARFNNPVGLELTNNNELIVVDYWNHSIRMVSADGIVSTLAGNGSEGYADGVGSTARFYRPIDVVSTSDGTSFVSDFGNHKIRRITPLGSVSTFAGGKPGYKNGSSYEARFRFPAGITMAPNDTLYVCDSENNLIRWIAPNGEVGTYVGSGNFGFVNGYGTEVQFRWPFGLDSDNKRRLFVADHTNHSIRLVSKEKFVSTLSGGGEAGYQEGHDSEVRFNAPYDVVIDKNYYVYVADYKNNRIRIISPTGLVKTLAGNDPAGFENGDESEARFNGPIGLAVNDEGTVLFVADHHNHVIRKITIE